MELGLRTRDALRFKLNGKIEEDIRAAASGTVETADKEKLLNDAVDWVSEYPQTLKDSKRPVTAVVKFLKTNDAASFEAVKKKVMKSGNEQEKALLGKLEAIVRKN
jgi:hypothetical protein